MVMSGASDPSRVRIAGPVGRFSDDLVRELQTLGYATTTSTELMRLAAHLSRWLQDAGLGLADLTPSVIDAFVAERRRSYGKLASARGLDPIVGYLRRVGAVPEPQPVAPETAAQVALAGFVEHLLDERGLSRPVTAAYAHWVGPFVEQLLCPPGSQAPRDVTAGELVAFLARALPALSGKSAQMTATSLRSMLRFGHAQGWLSRDLRAAVPPVAQWRLSGLPRPLTQAQVQTLLDACDPASPVGSRDRAVIVLMRRLALRSAEVAALRLEDVDWVGGTVLVRARAAASTGCRYRPTSARPSCATCKVVARRHRSARCSSARSRRSPRWGAPPSAASWPGPPAAPVWGLSTATGCGTPPRATP